MDEPSWFDNFVRNKIGQPNGWPWSAQRGRVGPMDGPNNPRGPHASVQRTEATLCVSGGERDMDEPSRVTRRILHLALRASGFATVRYGILPSRATNSPGASKTAERLAPQRAARKGWAHEWPQQSPRTSRLSAAHRKARVLLAVKGCGRILPPHSTHPARASP